MKASRYAITSLLALALAACGGGKSAGSGSLESDLNKGKALAELGPVDINEGYLEVLSRVNPNISAQIKTPAGKKRLIDSLLEQELLYKESLNRGIPDKPEVQEKAALYERVIYAQAVLDDAVDKKSKEYYEQNKEKEFSRVKVAHILLKTAPTPPAPGDKGKPPAQPDTKALEAAALKKAQEAKAKLAGGAAWEVVVTEYSDDRGTKTRGGEIGLLSRGDRRAERLGWNELIEKSFTMKAGEISDPILAKDGYHIVKVVEVAQVAPYEEVQNTIKFKLRSQVKNELMANLTKGKTTEYKDDSLKALGAPAAAAQPPTPAGGAAPSIQVEAKPAAPAAVAPAAPAADPKAAEKKTEAAAPEKQP
ncbi:MAG: peptidylprolyl isomerase [Deltaproteobacteria bacterium]|nr:peptidylprolyl isomerase [Deltaproteobacteria bacterium]